MTLIYGYQWKKLPSFTSSDTPSTLPPLTVLIAARNEAENLATHLSHILNLDYPEFEVLVVVNQSTDQSIKVLTSLMKNDSRLRYLEISEIPEGWTAKKWAIQRGVAEATYEGLALIDADCRPEENWLHGIGAAFAQGKELVLGLGFYHRYPGFLSAFIQYETLYTAFQYVGASEAGWPYMGVGRNLAYTRTFFQRHGGLTAWRDRLSGDDDLLVGAHAKSAKTTVMVSSGSKTWSEPPRTWRSWWAQKNRHLSASQVYPLRIKALIGIYHLSHLGLHLGFWFSMVVGTTNPWLICLYIMQVLCKGWGIRQVGRHDKERPLLLSLLGLDLSYFLYNLSVVPLGLIKRPEWKIRIPEYQKTPRKTENW